MKNWVKFTQIIHNYRDGTPEVAGFVYVDPNSVTLVKPDVSDTNVNINYGGSILAPFGIYVQEAPEVVIMQLQSALA